MGFLSFFGGSSSVSDKRRSVYERLIDQLKRELGDIEDKIERYKNWIYDNEQEARDKYKEWERKKDEYLKLHWAWQTEKDHRQKDKMRVDAGYALNITTQLEQKWKKYEREEKKLKRDLEDYERLYREKKQEIKDTERDFDHAMDELRTEIRELETEIREKEYYLRQYEKERDDAKYEMKYYKEDTERCEREVRNAKYKNKDQEIIEELEDRADDAREEYQKQKELFEEFQKECWKTEQKIRELKEELRDLEDAYR
jgi:chromosome segregation ATPase